jgi:serine/threonine protein kinase
MDNIYRHAIEYLRYWCRISGELPASCKFPDFVDFDIRLGHPHSSTSSSDVYKGEYLGVPVAVKIPRFHADNQSRAHRVRPPLHVCVCTDISGQAFRNEVVTWKCLRHPNIVPFMGISSISPVCLVSEWMPEGTLLAFLKRNPEEHRIKYVSTDRLHMRYLL